MIWSREEDFAQGTYRPALATHIRAALAPDGKPVAWSQLYIDNPAVGRNEAFRIPYAIPNQSIRSRRRAGRMSGSGPGAASRTRSTASTPNPSSTSWPTPPAAIRSSTGAISCPRARATGACSRPPPRRPAGARPLPAGVGRGIALVESFGSVVAHVIEASLGPRGVPRVHRVTAAVDCGEVCHPDTATAQVEGAIVMGLSAAIAEEITIDGGAVVQRSFPDYPILTLAETPPRIEVHFVDERRALGRARRARPAAGRPGPGQRHFRRHRPSPAHPAARRRGAKAAPQG